MTKTATNRSSLTVQDWVDAASELLGNEGIDAVRVEPLARKLSVTKGSFYWHFSNRNELLSAVLDAWRRRATSDIIKRLNNSNLTPEARLNSLFEFPKHGSHAMQGANLEIAIRRWAKIDDNARSAVTEVDQHRVSFIRNIYAEMGFSETDCDAKAVFFYCTLQGMSVVPELITDDILAHGKQILSGSLENQN